VDVDCEKLVPVVDVVETGMEVVVKTVVFVVVAAAVVVAVMEVSAEMGEVGGAKESVVAMEAVVETEAAFVEKTVESLMVSEKPAGGKRTALVGGMVTEKVAKGQVVAVGKILVVSSGAHEEQNSAYDGIVHRNFGEEIPQKGEEQIVAHNPHVNLHHVVLQMSRGDQCHDMFLNPGE